MLPNRNFLKKYAKEKNIPLNIRNLLTEYLQTQILFAMSLGKFNENLSFLGGTGLRLVYNLDRFSEDLDFDLVKKRGFNFDWDLKLKFLTNPIKNFDKEKFFIKLIELIFVSIFLFIYSFFQKKKEKQLEKVVLTQYRVSSVHKE